MINLIHLLAALCRTYEEANMHPSDPGAVGENTASLSSASLLIVVWRRSLPQGARYWKLVVHCGFVMSWRDLEEIEPSGTSQMANSH